MPPRRKQKPPEYEPDPVITTPKTEEVGGKELHRISTESTQIKIIPDKPDGDLPIVGDNSAKTRGFDEIWVHTADKYTPPPVKTAPKVPLDIPEPDVNPTTSTPKVTNLEQRVMVPSDETVDGWGKVIGHKEKRVVTT